MRQQCRPHNIITNFAFHTLGLHISTPAFSDVQPAGPIDRLLHFPLPHIQRPQEAPSLEGPG